MKDGGMGSLKFIGAAGRKFGGRLAEAELQDAGGVALSFNPICSWIAVKNGGPETSKPLAKESEPALQSTRIQDGHPAFSYLWRDEYRQWPRLIERAIDLSADGVISDYPERVPKHRTTW
jgi:hypothetical protein